MNDWKAVLEQNPDLANQIEKVEFRKMGNRTTVCVAVLKNGFELTGFSATGEQAEYNREIGRYWAMMGVTRRYTSLMDRGVIQGAPVRGDERPVAKPMKKEDPLKEKPGKFTCFADDPIACSYPKCDCDK